MIYIIAYMPYSLDHIRTFAAVADQGSLLAASRQLGLTQPTAGRHIDLLEAHLGFPLFTRGREGMTLTPKGADLFGRAAEMMERAEAFDRAASGLEEQIGGTIRISANEILGALLLPALIADFMRDHPEIEVELEVSNAATNLLRRDADIAIRMFCPTQNDLIARKVREVPMGLFAHANYLAARDVPQTLEDLKAHVLIGEDRSQSLIAAFRAMGVEVLPAQFQFRCDSNVACLHAVRAGIGIGPLHIEMAARWPDVRQVLPDLAIPPLELWLASHADLKTNRRIRLVMDYLGERLASPYGV